MVDRLDGALDIRANYSLRSATEREGSISSIVAILILAPLTQAPNRARNVIAV